MPQAAAIRFIGFFVLATHPHMCAAHQPLARTHLYALKKKPAWLRKVFLFVFLQEDKETRHQERRPAHPVFRPATSRYKQKFFCGPEIKPESLKKKKVLGFVPSADFLVWK